MSNNTYWAEAAAHLDFVDDDWTDNFGQGIEDGKFGLATGDVVIEGTLDELRDMAERIIKKCDAKVTAAYDARYQAWHGENDECADGCGLAVDHDPPCRTKPNGAVLSNEPMGTIGAPR